MMSASALQIGLFASYQAIPRAEVGDVRHQKELVVCPLETPKRA